MVRLLTKIQTRRCPAAIDISPDSRPPTIAKTWHELISGLLASSPSLCLPTIFDLLAKLGKIFYYPASTDS